MKSVYNVGDTVIYKNSPQNITRTDIGSTSGELYLEPKCVWADCKDVKLSADYSKYKHLVKGGVVCKLGEELCFFPFSKSIPESAPPQVIDHWLQWLNREGEEEHAI